MQDENVGKVIEDIRRNRNMTVEALCEGIISPSTYSRFVNGKTSLASNSFLKLVFRLHMTFAMFLQDYLDFFRIKHHYAILNNAKSYEELSSVLELIDDYQARFAAFQKKPNTNHTWQVQDERFLMVATALVKQLTNSPDRQQHLEIFQKHMIQYTGLSDNDFFGLKLLLPYMTIKEAEAIVKKPMKQLTSLKDPALAENLFYVCGILYIKYLATGDLQKADDYYQMLDKIYLDSLDLGWKLSRKLFQNIHLYFTGDTDIAVDQLNKLSLFYTDLNLPHQSQFIAQTCRELNIPHQEVEAMR